MSESTVDLTIIGGGVLGAFHAVAALERGLSVRLLERHSWPEGASVRNFGQVVPSGLDCEWQQHGRESLRIYDRLQQQTDLTIRKRGTIYIASDEDELTLLEELRSLNRSRDYDCELWTPAECRQRYPQLRADYCRGGLFFPQEVSVNPRLMVHRLHDWLNQQSGHAEKTEACVQRLESVNGMVEAETTDGQVYRSSKAILCCGHEFRQLYPGLFSASRLVAVKLQMLRLKPLKDVIIPGNVLTGLSIRRYESFAECPSWTAIKSKEQTDEFARKWGVHILFKQEEDGSIILGDSHEYADAIDADRLGFDLRHDINEYFLQEGRKIFDLPVWKMESSWYGIYSQIEDPAGLFKHTIDDCIHIVTGIGGKGMTSSAGFAKHHLKEVYND